jgi:DNA-binding GntR family transcriptional regulator
MRADSDRPDDTGAVARPEVNLSQSTYDEIRRLIVRGEIRPNERLIEVDLADRFGVSRTPVREALQRLASDALVVPARRGWLVREMTIAEIREIYEVREALEAYAARHAAERATEEDIEALTTIIARRSADVPPAGQRALFVEENDAFHDAVVEAARNQRLMRYIRRNKDYYYNVRLTQLYSAEEINASMSQHARIMDAIKRHAPGEAEEMMRDHIRDAMRVIERHFG